MEYYRSVQEEGVENGESCLSLIQAKDMGRDEVDRRQQFKDWVSIFQGCPVDEDEGEDVKKCFTYKYSGTVNTTQRLKNKREIEY